MRMQAFKALDTRDANETLKSRDLQKVLKPIAVMSSWETCTCMDMFASM